MTELELARKLGLVKKRMSRNFNNIALLNPRLVEKVLSLKAEHDNHQREVIYVLDIDDTPPPTPTRKAEETIAVFGEADDSFFELEESLPVPISNIEKGEVVLSMSDHKERKNRENFEKLASLLEPLDDVASVS